MKPIRTLSIHWESLSLNRRKSTRDTRWRLCSWLFSLVWFVLLKKTKLWEVPQRYQGRSDLGGGHVCVCVCVCVCVYSFSGFLMLIHKQFVSLACNTAPFIGSIPVLFGVSSLLCINWLVYFYSSCNRERGSENKRWIWELAFQIRA